MGRQNQTAIVVLGVNYGTDALSLRFVRSVSAMSQGANAAIVLVDNSDRAESTAFFGQVHAENPDVLCVKPPTNLGYLRGAAFGLEQWLTGGQDFQWVIVSNVDVEFPDCNFFAHLRAMEQVENIGVVAPSIWSNAARHDQNPMMPLRPSKLTMKFYRHIYRNYYVLNMHSLLALLYHLAGHVVRSKLLPPVRRLTAWRGSRAEPRASVAQDDFQCIYAPHGACMIFSHDFFARGGSLQIPLFLFGEEILIAETVHRLGLKVIYNPKLRLAHDEKRSTGIGRGMYSRQAAARKYESTAYLVDHYFQ